MKKILLLLLISAIITQCKKKEDTPVYYSVYFSRLVDTLPTIVKIDYSFGSYDHHQLVLDQSWELIKNCYHDNKVTLEVLSSTNIRHLEMRIETKGRSKVKECNSSNCQMDITEYLYN